MKSLIIQKEQEINYANNSTMHELGGGEQFLQMSKMLQ